MRALLTTVTLATLASGCVGGESTEPPVVGIRNMYNQPRYDTQERQPFFPDHRSMRPQVEGTVSREMEKSLPWATGRAVNEDAWLLEVPAKLVERNGGSGAFLRRGQDRYNIYCAVCHSIVGDGRGMVSRRAESLGATGLIARSLHEDRIRHMPDGQIFATITNGVRNMPSYAYNLPVDDRWAIVEYVRALQLSQAPAAAPENTEQPQ
jgi:mono/diheme cytochrome c family protein